MVYRSKYWALIVAGCGIVGAVPTAKAGAVGGVYCCNSGSLHSHVLSAATTGPGGELLTDGPSGSDFTYIGASSNSKTKWTQGPNGARQFFETAPNGPQEAGSATWSVMASGLTSANGTTSTTFTSLFGGDEVSLFNAALNVWASASGFDNLGQVTDGGGASGASGSAGRLGDIRIAAAPIDGQFNVLASAFQPGNESIFGAGGFKAGDITFDNGETWSDDPTDNNSDADFDFFTVALHELGHALGLDHSTVSGSVMEATYAGARRTLAADDLAGIRAIYGLQAVPEPGVLGLLALSGTLLLRRPRAK